MALCAALESEPARAGEAEAAQPELAVVTALGADHPLMRSAVSQLLENGVHFEQGPNQTLLSRLPDDFERYRAVLFDAPALDTVLQDNAARRRLETYAAGKGFVFQVANPIPPGGLEPGVNPNQLLDLVTSNAVFDAIAHGGLMPRHPQARRIQLDRTDESILAAVKAELLRQLASIRRWSEYTLHNFKAAHALIRMGGHDDVERALIESVRELSKNIDAPIHHDKLAGYISIAWFSEKMGEREALDRVRTLMDDLLQRRPREAGILTAGGFQDDPLLLSSQQGPPFHFDEAGTTVRRKVLWTEILHMHGPTFAALSRRTGDPKYLDEVVLLFDATRRCNLREDGLFAHISRDGRPGAGAWGRGQTHALYGMIYMLEEMDRKHPAFDRIVAVLNTVGRALQKHQDPETGLWRNLIDNPASRLESSCSTGISYCYARGIREGWIDRATFEPMVRRAWDGLKLLYWRNGLAANCRGTATGNDAYYIARPQGWVWMPHYVMTLAEKLQADRWPK